MNKNKKIAILVALVIIVGIIVALTAKFNVDLMTREHAQVQLDLKKEFNVSDVKEITKEVFNGKEVEVQKVEVYEKQVLISTSEITDEQKSNLVTKVNEKFGTEISNDSTEVVIVPRTKLTDIVTKYIWTFVITTVLVVIYEIIKYRKLGTLKVLLQTVVGIAALEAFVFSISAITRIPIGVNIPSIMFTTYVISLFGLTSMFENNLKELKAEEAKNTKK